LKKFMVVVEYDGTAYHGWQLQKALPTVQGEMERAVARIVQDAVRVHGAGRTDAGVHATGQVAHFLASWSATCGQLRNGWNALLPKDITVLSIEPAPDEFHARHSAHSKTYVYRILNRTVRSPLKRLYSWHVPYELDLSLMSEATEHLLGSHDFAAFGSPTDGTPSTVREVLEARWDSDSPDGSLRFTICGTGFLRYMVRSLVGTLVLVGKQKVTPSAFLQVIRSCDRSQSGPTAPPHGLCLESVDYGNAILKKEFDPCLNLFT
jgi:tRNA pseudouridine38-40 synthase